MGSKVGSIVVIGRGMFVGVGIDTLVGKGRGIIEGADDCVKHVADASGELLGQTKQYVDLPRGEYCPAGHDAQAAPV